MHGLGNDFVILFDEVNIPKANVIRALSDRKKGIGCDMVVILNKVQSDLANYQALFFNSDGSSAEICGNALRCIGKMHYKRCNSKICVVETKAGLIDIEIGEDNLINVDIGVPKFKWNDIPLSKELNCYDLGFDFEYLKKGYAVNIGNPHLVFVVEELDKKKLLVDSNKVFETKIFKDGVNISVVKIESKKAISVLTNERGVGLTNACGTGACASVVATSKMNLVDNKVLVKMLGGTIKVEISVNNHIFMIGEASEVFEGKINLKNFYDAQKR